MTHFSLPLTAESALVPCGPWMAEPIASLVNQNLERLKPWEPWAHFPQTPESIRAYLTQQMHAWVDGQALQTAIMLNGVPVGQIGTRIDSFTGTADLGYWVDAAAEGQGLVTAGVQALMDYLHEVHGVRRFEIRAAVKNTRSRAVPERLGFSLEGTLTAALVVGEDVQDSALYGLVP